MKYLKYFDTFGTPYVQNFTPNDIIRVYFDILQLCVPGIDWVFQYYPDSFSIKCFLKWLAKEYSIQEENMYFYSKLGGILSITIYTLSLAYLIYILHQWITGGLLPKTTSIRSASNFTEFTYSEDEKLIEFSYWKYNESLIDPFRQQNNILMPLLVQFIGGIPTKPISLLSNSYANPFGGQTIGVKNISLVQNSYFNTEQTLSTETLIMFGLCKKELLESHQSCADDIEIDNFFNQGTNYVTIWLHFKQYDPISKQIKNIRKQVYFPFDRQSQLQGQFMFQSTKAFVDNNILFESDESFLYIEETQIVTSTQKVDFWRNMFNQDCFISVFLRLDPFITDFHVSSPKVGEVLASVGSLVSILLSVRIVMERYNRSLLDKSQIKDVLTIYFPDFYNWTREEKQEFIKKKQSIAKQKLLLSNIIYEISRIQFFIQTTFSRESLYSELFRLTLIILNFIIFSIKDTLKLGLSKSPPLSNLNSLESKIGIEALNEHYFGLLTFPQYTTRTFRKSMMKVSDKLLNL